MLQYVYVVINLNILVCSKWIICQNLLRIHPALLRKDSYFKTLPGGKLVKILALAGSIELSQETLEEIMYFDALNIPVVVLWHTKFFWQQIHLFKRKSLC